MSATERESTCDLAEVRLDQLPFSPDELRSMLDDIDTPLLLTARHPAEGGFAPTDPVQRMAMIEPLLDRAALVDLEIRSATEMQPLIKKARALDVPVVGSFHDFHSTPPDGVLEGAMGFAQTAGLDAVKFATFLNSEEDLVRLIRLASAQHRLRTAVMGMGPWGRVSRLVLAKCGSLLNYGYVGDSNAPGQWPAARLKTLLSEI
ncbi:MAG: type I 3-dehydroquinate dehydratase [Verrucomicrobiales bacterium]|nr:type I 3-dehydroquinate dehydratase [Verrucomicrobiales bacterium]